ncbi:MAG TPA: cytochrome c [Acidobacteriaceae bacterium]|jgi:mono/diheme cytochrome c family protein|nr:cytochrome c [Acidobacteriaceae bacterium]
MRKRSVVGGILVAGLVGFTMLLAGCKPPLGPSKPLSQLTPQEAQGSAVYQQYCAGCHYANQAGDLHGPSLFAMYRKKYLPSGAPANDARVTPVILQGRNMMPGFASQLSDQQLQDLLAYLHTL